MQKRLCILLIFAAAMMLFAFGCASADIADGLVYDETDNTWAAMDEDLTELAGIMKRECAKSLQIKRSHADQCSNAESNQRTLTEADTLFPDSDNEASRIHHSVHTDSTKRATPIFRQLSQTTV